MKRVRTLPTLGLLAAATLIPIVVLSWLGVRVLQQDRDAERQRQSDSLQVTARRLALDMTAWLQDLDARVLRGEGLALGPTGPESTRENPLLYGASLIIGNSIRTPELIAAEALEYRTQDLPSAADAYRRAARSTSTQVRAAALLGLGGVLAKRGDLEGALTSYRDLERLGDVPVGGQPSALVALNARCRTLAKRGQSDRLRSEALSFAHTLHAGGWLIDRPTFENYQADLLSWGAPAAPASTVARTLAAIELWQDWRDGKLPARGQRIFNVGTESVLATWATATSRTVAWLTTAAELQTAFEPLARAQGLRVGAYDDQDRALFGEEHVAGPLLTKSDTRLPFTLRIAALDAAAIDLQDRRRRFVLIASLSVALVLMIAAAYGLYRTTIRQLELAKQQTDFVSAVSHEFRTPLTSMRHLTDLLATRTVPDDERVRFYGLLTRETERLHRLVEGLLSFGRIEAGGYAWRRDTVDVGALAAEVAADFRNEPLARSREITCEVDAELPAVRADTDGLSRALWNLLDNAAKYSAADAPVSVSVRRFGTSVHIAVQDRGIGIEPEERKTVFQKFVRGAKAKRAGIGGVGLGLSLVARIVEAHGGSVELESEPGHGSTFTLVLPCIAS